MIKVQHRNLKGQSSNPFRHDYKITISATLIDNDFLYLQFFISKKSCSSLRCLSK